MASDLAFHTLLTLAVPDSPEDTSEDLAFPRMVVSVPADEGDRDTGEPDISINK